jgi:hypothetical protein
MKQRIAVGFATLALAGACAPFASAQEPTTPPIKPVSHAEAPDVPKALRGYHASARSGAEWLVRVHNDVSGRFLPGWLPAVNAPADDGDFLHQAAATAALARAARYYHDERYLMKARQAMLSLLADTRPDPADPTCRITTQPVLIVNPLAAAGALLVAIHELQSPADDLLRQGEELANYIRKQQQPDGSFADGAPGPTNWAVHGLVASLRNGQAAWKLEAIAKALPACRKQWQAGPSLARAAGLTPAFAEAFARTKDQAYADFVFAMCDWSCDFQYGVDATQPAWVGGFKAVEHGKPALRAPDVSCAGNVGALALGCLVTLHAKDDARYRRYHEATELGCRFLTGLQYTDGNTGHFTPGYRTALIGGYHASLRDGNLRLDYNAQAVTALVTRLTCVGDR